MKKLIFGLILVMFFGYLPVVTQASAKVIPNMEFQKRPPKPPKPPKPKSPKKPKPPPKPRKPPRPPR